jgi:hypothetical protein
MEQESKSGRAPAATVLEFSTSVQQRRLDLHPDAEATLGGEETPFLALGVRRHCGLLEGPPLLLLLLRELAPLLLRLLHPRVLLRLVLRSLCALSSEALLITRPSLSLEAFLSLRKLPEVLGDALATHLAPDGRVAQVDPRVEARQQSEYVDPFERYRRRWHLLADEQAAA